MHAARGVSTRHAASVLGIHVGDFPDALATSQGVATGDRLCPRGNLPRGTERTARTFQPVLDESIALSHSASQWPGGTGRLPVPPNRIGPRRTPFSSTLSLRRATRRCDTAVV